MYKINGKPVCKKMIKKAFYYEEQARLHDYCPKLNKKYTDKAEDIYKAAEKGWSIIK